MAEKKDPQKLAEAQSMGSDMAQKTPNQQPADQLKNAGQNQAAKANSKTQQTPAESSERVVKSASQDETLD